MLRRFVKNFIDHISKFKSALIGFLFKNSPKRRKVFEMAGYFLVTFHLARMTLNWYKHRHIESNLISRLKKSAQQVTEKNRWIVLVIPDSSFKMDDWLTKFLIQERYSVFFGRFGDKEFMTI